MNLCIYFFSDEKESIYLEPMCIYLCSIQNEIPIPVIKAILFNISVNIKYVIFHSIHY
jgi:hypothetical protein